MADISKICPSLRDIFYLFDFTNRTTSEYAKDSAKFDREIRKETINPDELDDLVTGLTLEARAMGFEDGFACAVKILLNGGDNTRNYHTN